MYLRRKLTSEMQDNSSRFEQALAQDLGRHVHDTHLCELGSCHSAIMSCLKNIDSWTKTKSAAFDVQWFAMSPKIRQEPRGVVLIISRELPSTFLQHFADLKLVSKPSTTLVSRAWIFVAIIRVS